MSIESTDDWDGLKLAAEIARLTLDLLEEHVRPGVTTGDLDAEAVRVRSRGRQPVGPPQAHVGHHTWSANRADGRGGMTGHRNPSVLC